MKNSCKICIWILALLMASCLVLAACSHTHSTAEGWQKDATHHWHTCTDCEEKLEYAEHEWSDAIANGVKTCIICGQTETVSPAPHIHSPATTWTSDATQHWHTCSGCEEKLDAANHDWEVATAGNIKTYTCKVCKKEKTETVEPPAPQNFTVTFVADDNVEVFVYDTQNLSGDGTKTDIAYAKSQDGEILTDGNGQVNFKLQIAEGFVLESIKIETANAAVDSLGFKNLKSSSEIGVENAYRITKIYQDLVVTIATIPVQEVDAWTVRFQMDEHCAVVASYENSANMFYTRTDKGESFGALTKADGQINFHLQLENGFIVDEISIANADGSDKINYKNFKSSENDPDFAAYQYRITKISADLVVTVTTKQAPFEATFLFVDEEGNAVANAASVLVYNSQDYTAAGTEITSSDVVAYIRNGDTGAVDTSGSGQLNFKVIVADGYTLVNIDVSGSYKNLKGADETKAEDTYRITKVGSNIVVTVVVAQ